MKKSFPSFWRPSFQHGSGTGGHFKHQPEGRRSLAQRDAPDVQIAGTALSKTTGGISLLANYKPQINFCSTLPNLNRSIEAVTQPDGSDVFFINRSLMRNSLNISLEQDIA